jgi:hypothetical protein
MGNPAQGGDRKKKFEITPQEAIAQVARKDADIRQEANAPGMSFAERAKVNAVVAAARHKAEEELAAYEKFKHEQQLELAEASAARVYIINGGGGEMQQPEMRKSNFTRVSNTHGGLAKAMAAYRSVDQSFMKTESVHASSKDAPARFYKRQVLERSADQLVQASIEANEAGARQEAATGGAEGSAPFAAPVPGRPGFVSSPGDANGGLIDVRGYKPGALVRDPYSGQPMRIP